MGPGDGCRRQDGGAGDRWQVGPGTRDQRGAQPGTRRRTAPVDLQMPELIACCLQLGFIAQLLINCFRI